MSTKWVAPDRGPSYLSKRLKEVFKLMGIATSYHPQTNGLVEWFNRTPTDRVAMQDSQGRLELPTSLHTLHLSIEPRGVHSRITLLSSLGLWSKVISGGITPLPSRAEVYSDDYKTEVLHSVQEAWDLARKTSGRHRKSKRIITISILKSQHFEWEDVYFSLHLQSSRVKTCTFALPH